jgi:hypothetical protein
MPIKEEFAEAQRRFGLLSFYDKFEHIVILILTALIAVFIVFAVWNLALKIFLSIASSTFDPTDYAVFQAVFGMTQSSSGRCWWQQSGTTVSSKSVL